MSNRTPGPCLRISSELVEVESQIRALNEDLNDSTYFCDDSFLSPELGSCIFKDSPQVGGATVLHSRSHSSERSTQICETSGEVVAFELFESSRGRHPCLV